MCCIDRLSRLPLADMSLCTANCLFVTKLDVPTVWAFPVPILSRQVENPIFYGALIITGF